MYVQTIFMCYPQNKSYYWDDHTFILVIDVEKKEGSPFPTFDVSSEKWFSLHAPV